MDTIGILNKIITYKIFIQDNNHWVYSISIYWLYIKNLQLFFYIRESLLKKVSFALIRHDWNYWQFWYCLIEPSSIMETIIFTFFIIILIYKLNFQLAIENLALRQQLTIMKQSIHRPKIRKRDRLFWVIFSRLWHGWENVLIVLQPETVIRLHRKDFKLYWTFKSKKTESGRPPTDIKVQRIVKKMIKENLLWGSPILHGELLKLGIEISERTVSNMIRKYKHGKGPLF